MDSEKLRIAYQDNIGRAERLRDAVIVQLLELFAPANITLGVPIESRIKDLTSIFEKIERKSIKLENILELQDLIGIRCILLFKRDLVEIKKLITNTFEIISSEDTGDRLSDSEFGYQSQHYIVRIPTAWLSLPSLSGLNEFFIELQIRTLAQHIWAAASHKLQYKNESGVPLPVRRSINRVSALLETVDLEFERVLKDRDDYVTHVKSSITKDELINVDNLAKVLADMLPANNIADNEPYAALLDDLTKLGVTHTNRLKEIIKSHLGKALEEERGKAITPIIKLAAAPNTEWCNRYERGAYYTHTGLTRIMLKEEFGSEIVNKISHVICQPLFIHPDLETPTNE